MHSSLVCNVSSDIKGDPEFNNWVNDGDNARKVITSFFKKVQGSNFIERWCLTVKDKLSSWLKHDKVIYKQREKINQLRLDKFVAYLNEKNFLNIIDELSDNAEENLLTSKVGKGVNKLFDDISKIYSTSKKSNPLPSKESYIKEQYFTQMFNKDINAVCNGEDSEQKAQVKNFLAFLYKNKLKGEDADKAIEEFLKAPEFDIKHPENYLPYFFKNSLLGKINSFLNKDNINKLNQSIKDFYKKCNNELIQHFYISNIKSKLHDLFYFGYHEPAWNGAVIKFSEDKKLSAANDKSFINKKIELINRITNDIKNFNKSINKSSEGMQMFSGPLGKNLQNIIKNYDPTSLLYSFWNQYVKIGGEDKQNLQKILNELDKKLTPYQYSKLDTDETEKLNTLFSDLPNKLGDYITKANDHNDALKDKEIIKYKTCKPKDMLLEEIRDVLGINMDIKKKDALLKNLLEKKAKKEGMEENKENLHHLYQNNEEYRSLISGCEKLYNQYMLGTKTNANKDKIALYNKLKEKVEENYFFTKGEDKKYKALSGDNNDLQFNLIKLGKMLPNQDKLIMDEANFKTLVQYLASPKVYEEYNMPLDDIILELKKIIRSTTEMDEKGRKETLTQLKDFFKDKITANKDKETLFNKEIDGLCDSLISFLINEKNKENKYGYTDKTTNFFLLYSDTGRKSERYLNKLENKIDSYENSKEIESIKNNYKSCIKAIEKGYKATLALSNKKWGTYWKESQEKEEKQKQINTLQKMYAAYSLYREAENKPSVV